MANRTGHGGAGRYSKNVSNCNKIKKNLRKNKNKIKLVGPVLATSRLLLVFQCLAHIFGRGISIAIRAPALMLASHLRQSTYDSQQSVTTAHGPMNCILLVDSHSVGDFHVFLSSLFFLQRHSIAHTQLTSVCVCVGLFCHHTHTPSVRCTRRKGV